MWQKYILPIIRLAHAPKRGGLTSSNWSQFNVRRVLSVALLSLSILTFSNPPAFAPEVTDIPRERPDLINRRISVQDAAAINNFRYKYAKRQSDIAAANKVLAPAEFAEGASHVVLPGGEDAYEIRPGLVVPSSDMTAAAKEFLSTKISDRKRVIASFVDPTRKEYGEIKQTSGPSYFDLPSSRDELMSFFAANRGSIIIVVGHSLNGDLIREDSDGKEKSRVDLDLLETLAFDNRVTVLFETCEAASQITGSGPVGILFGAQIIHGIRRSVKAETYSDFLAAFGTKKNPIVARNIQRDLDYLLTLETELKENGRTYQGRLRDNAAYSAMPSPPRLQSSQDNSYDWGDDPALGAFILFVIFIISLAAKGSGRSEVPPQPTQAEMQLAEKYERLTEDDCELPRYLPFVLQYLKTLPYGATAGLRAALVHLDEKRIPAAVFDQISAILVFSTMNLSDELKVRLGVNHLASIEKVRRETGPAWKMELIGHAFIEYSMKLTELERAARFIIYVLNMTEEPKRDGT